jgi:F0F1-type ATP synthase assembly protein I
LPEPRPVSRTYLRDPLQIGGTIVGVTVVFGGVGWWIDSLIGTFPFGMMLGSVIGLFGVIYLNYLWLKEMDRQETESLKDRDSGDSNSPA